MPPTTRVQLARLAYDAALRAARERSTPHTWGRLLRAARNLREASEERRGRAVHDTRRGD
ncbi:MAG TPA: hypothetical protein VFP65_05880 [Anaeromyxobacteraceae bacterium]|nr:hypothetical protein [Anaeromyxobacteraceae bacterium]